METVSMSSTPRRRGTASATATKTMARRSNDKNLVEFPYRATAEQLAFLEAELASARRMIAGQQNRIEQLENLTLTDELTGLYNRRGFYHMLDRELTHTLRKTERRGAVIMVDLDDFKKINDTFGHQAGDAYLRAAAQKLNMMVRSHDHVARLGGDEFAMILTDIDPPTALMRATTIDRAFNSHVILWGETKLPLKASFGTTIFQRDDQVDDIISAADLKLYAHKVRRKQMLG